MKVDLKKIYSQLDPAYSSTPIGNLTIKDIGCLTCDVAMIATYFGHEITPSNLARSVNYSGNLWVWSELNRLYSDITYQGQIQTPTELSTTQMNDIKKLIDQGYPVLLQIDVIPSTPYNLDEHWVLAVDYNGDDFKVVNPYGGYIHNITDYGVKPQLLIWAYAWYKGKLPTSSNSDALNECLRQHTQLVTELENYKKTYKYTQADLDSKVAQAKNDIKNKIINLANNI